jgi:hypothetical protein
MVHFAVGMRIMLPSGNIVVLVRRERGVWICEYTEHSRARGEVSFGTGWLRKYGVRAG